MKKQLLLLIAGLLSVCAVFSSCSGKEDGGSAPPVTPSDTGETEAEENEIPETEADKVDVLSKSFTPKLQAALGLDGYETNILLRLEGYAWSNPDIVAEETTGERLNDAVFNRNA